MLISSRVGSINIVIPSAMNAYDTFTRADNNTTMGNAESGQAWVVSNEAWGIASNRACYKGTAPDALATLDVGSGNVDMSAILMFGSAGDCGAVARVVDSSNYIMFYLWGDSMHIFKRVAGKTTQLAVRTKTYTANTDYTAHITLLDKNLSLTIGTDTITYTLSDAEYAVFGNAVGKHGFLANNQASRYDNFNVTQI